MRPPTAQLDRAKRLLASEGSAERPEACAAAAGRVYDKLDTHLAPLLGLAGVQALFARSAKLAQAEGASLAEGAAGSEGSTKLRAYLQSLERGRLDADDRDAVTRINSSCQRMKRMIMQLLDFTRVRLGGGFPIEPTPGDLRDICGVVAQEFGAPVHLELEGDLTGSWDTDRLVEALSNITRNAIEHAAPGTRVVVRARAENGEVVVEISNRGSAIPADLVPVIFEPFQRGKREKATTGNLGLGLYIAKQIVLAAGGTLDVRSAGGTTIFVMRLPRQAASARPASSKAEARRRSDDADERRSNRGHP